MSDLQPIGQTSAVIFAQIADRMERNVGLLPAWRELGALKECVRRAETLMEAAGSTKDPDLYELQMERGRSACDAGIAAMQRLRAALVPMAIEPAPEPEINAPVAFGDEYR